MANLTPEQIATASGCPLENVAKCWPLILDALTEFNINTPNVQVAAAATVAVETGAFLPVAERKANGEKQPAVWALQSRYWPTGFYGRGFIQITWKSNYERFGKLLGLALVSTPDLAIDPGVAARVLAAFFKENHIDAAANNADWQRTRKMVNGGLNGWDKYIAIINKLLA